MVTARFKVGRVTLFQPTDPIEFAKAVEERRDGTSCEIEMVPDYADGANHEWAKATPSGVFRMHITNPGAIEQLMEHGKSLHIEISAH